MGEVEEKPRRSAGKHAAAQKPPMPWYKVLLFCVISLVVSCVLGIALLAGAFSLPMESVHAHAEADKARFMDIEQPVALEYPCMWADRYTDALMVLEPLYQETLDIALLDRVLSVYQPVGSEDSAMKLLHFLDGVKQGDPISYGRYWHGYEVIFVPLLQVFTYTQVIVFNAVFLLAMALLIVLLLFKRRLDWLVLPFLLCFVCMTPWVVAKSMCYMASLSLALIGTAAVLAWGSAWVKRGVAPIAFCIIGIVVNYLDFMDFPLVSLGMPLVVLVSLEKQRGWRNISLGLYCAVAWSFGYFAMWIAKWVLATLFTQSNIIEDAITQARFRSQTSSVGFNGEIAEGYKDVISIVLIQYKGLFWFVLAGVYLLALVIQEVVVRAKHLGTMPTQHTKESEKPAVLLLCYAAIATLPFIWAAAAQNHTFMHFFFTWRIMNIAIFAGAAALSYLLWFARQGFGKARQ
ncbi:MAG: hypothetical protein IJ113_00545 [Eggerthellaceae bacterium]|nr:hypothetical protein [Eggerthellaceae bacterium]